MTTILGLNADHADSEFCLVRDGELSAAAEEERLRRIKHWAGLPIEAVRYCLAQAGIWLGDLAHITRLQHYRPASDGNRSANWPGHVEQSVRVASRHADVGAASSRTASSATAANAGAGDSQTDELHGELPGFGQMPPQSSTRATANGTWGASI